MNHKQDDEYGFWILCESMLENLASYLFKLFIVINPHIIVPFFLSCTQNYTNSERKTIANKMCLYGLFLGLIFALFGNSVLGLLGIPVSAFRMSGGVLLAVAAWGLLYSKEDKSSETASANHPSHADISLCPLAFPMFIGPATITTIINMMQSADQVGLVEKTTVILALAILILLTYVFLIFGSGLVKILGRNNLLILEKISGILLIAMSLTMIAGGAKDYFNSPSSVTVTPPLAPSNH